MKTRIIQLFCLLVFGINVQTSAQIGYQVSLLNSATGEPKVHTTVNAQVTLTNSLDEIILTENKSVTSNDFGVLSFTIGNENTLKEVDWNKLPFYISVKVDGVLIGKSQVLSVPVAEYAKQAGPIITKEMLMGKKWIYKDKLLGGEEEYAIYTFEKDKYTFEYYSSYTHDQGYEQAEYQIVGRKVYCFQSNDDKEVQLHNILEFLEQKNILIGDNGIIYK